MQAAVIQAEASRAAQSTREETYEALVSGMEEAREQVNELQQQILWLAGRFHGVETLEQADRQMERLEGILEAASEVQTKLQSLPRTGAKRLRRYDSSGHGGAKSTTQPADSAFVYGKGTGVSE